MKYLKEKLTFTNIVFIITVIVYILNIFVILPDTGSMSLKMIETFQTDGIELPNTLFFKIFGTWGDI